MPYFHQSTDFLHRSISFLMLCRYFLAEDQNVYAFLQSIFFVSLEHFIHTSIRTCIALRVRAKWYVYIFRPRRIRVMIHIKFISDPPLFSLPCTLCRNLNDIASYTLVYWEMSGIQWRSPIFLAPCYAYILHYLH